MTAPGIRDWATVRFCKSSCSSTNGGNCVEIGARFGVIGVRDSKSPGAGLIELPASAWAGFLSALRAGA
ncbi:DUF397 domain-containing protein [Actinophytocola oryzae]|uniref:Uncharacterized protein DUF397 n=1 Tax=Actinophytocola oryzae TaxID=502181 RepID=A0A4R7VQI6_9PSEU|nr:DUF397 domain-containing protein [Actinophytocola oryzae]TDV52013.1 uncharacterized protein DUF397 [Actinophytocola oryzae]